MRAMSVVQILLSALEALVLPNVMCPSKQCNPYWIKKFQGFGELFRFLSYRDDIGTKALASRAIGGVKDHTILFAIPGSVGAVTLAMKELILPEVKHLKRELIK